MRIAPVGRRAESSAARLVNKMGFVNVSNLKACFFVAMAWLVAGGSSGAADDPAARRAELDSVRSELARLQAGDSLQSPERWRQWDRAQFNVPEVAEIRVQVKALEKSLVEKRAALRERLLVLFPDLRDQLRARDAAYASLSEISVKAGLADNEIRLAEQAEPPAPEKVESLRAERTHLAAEEQAARAGAEAAQEAFLTQQKILSANDPACAALQTEIADLQTRFTQAQQQMNERIDALPESQEVEAERKAQVERVLQLRQREQELTTAIKSAN